jgi:hypothetical protein
MAAMVTQSYQKIGQGELMLSEGLSQHRHSLSPINGPNLEAFEVCRLWLRDDPDDAEPVRLINPKIRADHPVSLIAAL